jgi:V8-like Glu-specific endopeptidase
MNEWDREALINLREILANLYPTVDDARRVASDAGLRTVQIEFVNKAITSWFNILEHANARGKVDDVVNRALEDNPEDETLQRARDRTPPPVLQGPDKFQWSGPSAAPTLEKLMGQKSTLVPITYLEIGLVRARSVVRVKRQDGSSGTGFITDGNTLITNNHVLPNAEAARSSVIQFNYQQTAGGLNASIEEARLLPDGFFRTAAQDDWSAVRIDGDISSKWGMLPMARAEIKVGDHVNIIQHPGGGPKQISLFANVVVYVGGGRVQYLTDTLPGSSGSPVFDAQWNLIALHHSGGWLTEPNAASKTTYYRNEGISIDRIIDGLATRT